MRALILLVLAFVVMTDGRADDTFSHGRRFDERTGEAIYRQVCQGCHMPDGRGARGAGTYPSLAGNARLASPEYVASVVLGGRKNMPAFADTMDDAQIAAIVNHVRTRFGNAYPRALEVDEVARLRPRP